MSRFITLPNFLSLLRIPLAFLMLKQNIFCRGAAIILAMITDGLDGFLARRYQQSSQFGALLDPLTDRFFVYFTAGIFFFEGKLGIFEVAALACRDISVILFGFYLLVTGQISTYRFRAIWCGKVTTFFQFMIFLALAFGRSIHPAIYSLFILVGFLALIELYISKEKLSTPLQNKQ